MSRQLILILFMSATLLSLTQQSARQLVHQDLTSKKKLEAAINKLNANNGPVEKAYLGLCETMMAEYVFWPGTKLSYFNKGKEKIEASCKDKNNNTELRYIRLLVQLNAPSFLGYDNHISDDFNHFEQNLMTDTHIDQLWKIKFITELNKCKNINQNQKNRLQSLKQKLTTE